MVLLHGSTVDGWSAMQASACSTVHYPCAFTFLPTAFVVLILPAALSRGWISVPTSETVGGTLHGVVRSVQSSLSSHI